MKKRVLALVALVVLAAASVFASSSELYYTRAGMYTYYRIDTLKNSEFEFYFSIDSCTDIEEYIRINFPSNITSPTLGKIRISLCDFKNYGRYKRGSQKNLSEKWDKRLFLFFFSDLFHKTAFLLSKLGISTR